MNVRADQIERLQQELRQLLSLSETASQTSERSGVSRPDASTQAVNVELRTGLEGLIAGGESTYEELQKLQRALSRQTFRGAESARRLVRRLSRRTRQSVDAVHALLNCFQSELGAEASGPPVLGPGVRSRPDSTGESTDRP